MGHRDEHRGGAEGDRASTTLPRSTERLFFRRWSPEDLPLALELWGDARVTRYIDAREQLTDEDVRARLERELATQERIGICYWPILETATRDFVGCAGLRPYRDDVRVREFGVQLLHRHWGKGYAQEAGRAVIDHAFRRLGLDALFAGHHPDNEASSGMLKRLGFIWTHDELYEPTGREHPSYRLERSADSRRAVE